MEDTDVVSVVTEHGSAMDNLIADFCSKGYKLDGIAPRQIVAGYTKSYLCVFTKRTERIDI